MKRDLFFAIIVIVSVLSSCEGTEEPELIKIEYQDWEQTTDEELNYMIPGHMDRYRIIYINNIGTQVQPEEQGGRTVWDYPEGTIIMKEVYSESTIEEGEEPVALTAMIKDSDDPRARGGWVWVMCNIEAGTERVFEEEFCVTCHANANTQHPYGEGNPEAEFRDYVFFPYFQGSE
ncbi:MAG: cytochrome P460 family protein [Spirochaetia bacterium]